MRGGGCIHNSGTFTQTGISSLLQYTADGGPDGHDLNTVLFGVDRKYVTFSGTVTSEEKLRTLLEQVEGVLKCEISLSADVAALSGDITIPENVELRIHALTVPENVTLTNNGTIYVSGESLLVASGAKLVNNGTIEARSGATVTVASTLDNRTGAETIVCADGWNCSGKLLDNGGKFTRYKEVTTAAELEEALRQHMDVQMRANITLDRSITVPKNVELSTGQYELTVPAPYTLTNRGTIWVWSGRLDVGGTFIGDVVHAYYMGTVMPDSVPQITHGDVAESIAITGADAVTVGGTAGYAAKTYPEVLEYPGVIWTVVSGSEFATLTDDGVLTANAPGAVVIRAAATGRHGANSGVYDEMTVTVQAPPRLPGDVNGDGKVNSKDVTQLCRYVAGWLVEIDAQTADVNGDGKVNSKDVTQLRRYAAGWPAELK